MPALLMWSGPGPSRMAPTRIGASTASAAWLIRRAASVSWYGSTSEEFSGQTTSSGRSAVPA